MKLVKNENGYRYGDFDIISEGGGTWSVYVRAGLDHPELVARVKTRREAIRRADIYSAENTRCKRSAYDGRPVEVSYNTPLCCDPSSETYWSM